MSRPRLLPKETSPGESAACAEKLRIRFPGLVSVSSMGGDGGPWWSLFSVARVKN